MTIFLNIVSVSLILSGIFHFIQAVRQRYHLTYYKLGNIKIPAWVTKVGASFFIGALGAYILFTNVG